MISFLSLEYLILKQNKENDHFYKISLHPFLFACLFYCFSHSDTVFLLISMYGEELCIHCSSYGHSFYLDSSKSCQISKLEVRFKEDSDEELRSWRRIFISLWVETTCSFHPVIMSF